VLDIFGISIPIQTLATKSRTTSPKAKLTPFTKKTSDSKPTKTASRFAAKAVDPELTNDVEAAPTGESPFDEYTISPDEAADVTAQMVADALAQSGVVGEPISFPETSVIPSSKSTEESAADKGKTRKPLVAIVGRPNVGKSTLFNRMLGQSKSLITEIAGTTRDRKYGISEWKDYGMLLVDTGGMLGDSGDLSENIHQQALLALEEADFVLYVVGTSENPFVDAQLGTNATFRCHCWIAAAGKSSR
jgi:ribosome biogenesis GTPase A